MEHQDRSDSITKAENDSKLSLHIVFVYYYFRILLKFRIKKPGIRLLVDEALVIASICSS